VPAAAPFGAGLDAPYDETADGDEQTLFDAGE
jgi:hypothetical protein